MQDSDQKQNLDSLEVHLRIVRMRHAGVKISKAILARRLKRSAASITFALQGKRPVLLSRIKRHLDKISERKEMA
jgi:hypothetical protein